VEPDDDPKASFATEVVERDIVDVSGGVVIGPDVETPAPALVAAVSGPV
jgi:hypothetical protein